MTKSLSRDATANPADVEMDDGAQGTEDGKSAQDGEGSEGAENIDGNEGNGNTDMPFTDTMVPDPPTSFLTYLVSPIITLVVGSGESATRLSAHQALLVQSPYFEVFCAEFPDDGRPLEVLLPEEEIDAVGRVLEFLYTGEYFPKKITGTRSLESDPSIPAVDETGQQLLRHARVYTLAEKWGLAALKALASSKIHCINSTARGEIAYARYVYEHTNSGDTTVRAPIINFWAGRSHTLRTEAEEEFRDLCLEYPQFGYDVLTRVLDEKLKRERSEKPHPPVGTRKRARHSNT